MYVLMHNYTQTSMDHDRVIPVYGESHCSPDVPGQVRTEACPCLFLAQSQLREFLSTQ